MAIDPLSLPYVLERLVLRALADRGPLEAPRLEAYVDAPPDELRATVRMLGRLGLLAPEQGPGGVRLRITDEGRASLEAHYAGLAARAGEGDG